MIRTDVAVSTKSMSETTTATTTVYPIVKIDVLTTRIATNTHLPSDV
jgi:hypothetical protein